VSRLRVTVLGGGNGISAVLEGFARKVSGGAPLDVTAVVATADDGGSSGRLRRDRGGLPPGDLRNCLLALGSGDRPFARLFAHRYSGNGELGGHAVGNLILEALADIEGGYLRALSVAEDLLGATGRVLPSTLQGVKLEGRCRDGSRLSGETCIGSATAIERVWLEPGDVPPCPGVVEAVREADLLVVGPGSLFTSILPVLLVPGVADAVRGSRGRRVLVANLMSQPGETLGMSLADHLRSLDAHVGEGLVQDVLAHEGPLDADRLVPYACQDSVPLDPEGFDSRPERLRSAFLVTSSGKIRHDASRVTEALLSLAEPRRPSRAGLGAKGMARKGV
jgi:uncharacterized cofD-like protein